MQASLFPASPATGIILNHGNISPEQIERGRDLIASILRPHGFKLRTRVPLRATGFIYVVYLPWEREARRAFLYAGKPRDIRPKDSTISVPRTACANTVASATSV